MDTLQNNHPSEIDELLISNTTPLSDILLPNTWVLYLYNKKMFKQLATGLNFQAKPYKELCTLHTVNDVIYILQLMQVKVNQTKDNICLNSINVPINNNKLNLDANDYIIMRHGIEPVWEDVKNSNGGTFTIKMNHINGYDVWSNLVMYIVGETLTTDMDTINGISVSYIADNGHYQKPDVMNNNNSTFIKIWDGKSGRNKDQFVKILPQFIINKIIHESLVYSQNKEKPNFNGKDIMSKLNSKQSNNKDRQERGGFMTRGSRRGRR